jgi:hypothetical protein
MNSRSWMYFLAASGLAVTLGRGRVRADINCPRCNGSGRLPPQRDPSLGDGPGAYVVPICDMCDGSGRVSGGGGGGGCA